MFYFQEHKEGEKTIIYTLKTSIKGKKKYNPSPTYKQMHTYSHKIVFTFQTRKPPKNASVKVTSM
jgi:hypothetical protein